MPSHKRNVKRRLAEVNTLCETESMALTASVGGNDDTSISSANELDLPEPPRSSLQSLSLLPSTGSVQSLLKTTSGAATRKRKRSTSKMHDQSSDAHVTAGGRRLPLPHRRQFSSSDRLSSATVDTATDYEEIFLESTSPARVTRTSTGLNVSSSTSPLHLQHTPTSQLLSQKQTQSYAALRTASDVEPGIPTVEQQLFTPATVARRPLVPAECNSCAVPTSTNPPSSTLPNEAASPAISSASRPSFHDESVQAILRANPPTATRPAELKPGYGLPSPRSPLWTALESSGGEGDPESSLQRASVQSECEMVLTRTQVSLFQLEDDEARSGHIMATVPAVRTGFRTGEDAHSTCVESTPLNVDSHVAAATRERRRFGVGPSALASISLPPPGRSLNLLEEDGVSEDERLPLFVGLEGDREEVSEENIFSLTQEADRLERQQDCRLALPRSRGRRGATKRTQQVSSSLARATALTDSTTPSRPHSSHVHASCSGAKQISPYSQLQRDVEPAAASIGEEERWSTTAAIPQKPVVLSQKELRRRADMFKWAERARAFFHFIDTRPLHVTTSPLKTETSLPTAGRGRRSLSIVAAQAPSAINKAGGPRKSGASGGAAASVSLVGREYSARAVLAAANSMAITTSRPDSSLMTPRSNEAFDAVVSRVKREAAASTPASTPKARKSSVM